MCVRVGNGWTKFQIYQAVNCKSFYTYVQITYTSPHARDIIRSKRDFFPQQLPFDRKGEVTQNVYSRATNY